jgi:acetoacetate decarboxylase
MTSTAEASGSDYLWTNARLLAAEVAVSPQAAALLLPEALRLADPPTATLFVADYPETRFGSVYREAAVLLHASDAMGPALHCPWMVVDDDAALILGREMLGFPKKMAEIALEERGAHVVGTVRRRGTEVMRLEAELGEVEADPAPLFGQRMVNVIGTLVGGLQLVELAPTQERIRSSHRAEVKVTLASGDRDPLAELGAAPSGRARYLKLDFGAEGGTPPALAGAVDAAWVERRFFARAM